MDIHNISLLLFNAFLMPVIFFSLVYYIIALRSIFIKQKREDFGVEGVNWPRVTIQIPVYNDPVATRCIEHCLEFDYPKDKYEIVVADDSNDKATREEIDRYAKQPMLRIVRRNSREGFKAGALNNAMKYSNGEIIVIFDSDYTPQRDFLKRLIAPFLKDKKIVCVQTRMGYINAGQNLITKFASACLMVYHNCFMPINHNIGSVFFCGTGGAIRRDVLEELGCWNEKSLTEDADLSIRILNAGYRHVYLHKLKAPGELPFTLKSFIKQQMRWAYGMTRVFVEHWRDILFNKNFSIYQKGMITFITLGYIFCPFVLGMTLFGGLGWITGTPRAITIEDVMRTVGILAATSGFLFSLILATRRENVRGFVRATVFAVFAVGIIVAITNTISFTRALLGKEIVWSRTPKLGRIL